VGDGRGGEIVCAYCELRDPGDVHRAWATYVDGWHVAAEIVGDGCLDVDLITPLFERITGSDGGEVREAGRMVLLLHPWRPDPPSAPVAAIVE